MNQFDILPYHQTIVDYLKNHEKDLWQWFGSDDYNNHYKDELTLHLLKTTYRLQEETHSKAYKLAKHAMQSLEIELPLTLYQAQNQAGYNAALIFFEDQIAILITGNLFELLTDDELLAVFAHELSHHQFYAAHHHYFFRANRLLEWCAEQENPPHIWTETARRYQLFMEIYADRGGILACKNAKASIAGLIKVTTGIKQVDVSAYLEQTEEVLSKVKAGSNENTHPEIFIRAKILDLFEQEKVDLSAITHLVEGDLSIHQLDILGQQSLTHLTRTFFNIYGQQKIAQTEAAEIHIKHFFIEFTWQEPELEQAMIDDLKAVFKKVDESVILYFSYLLLDLVTTDAEQDELILVWSLQLSKALGFFKQYEVIARKELKRKKAELVKLAKNATLLLQKEA